MLVADQVALAGAARPIVANGAVERSGRLDLLAEAVALELAAAAGLLAAAATRVRRREQN